MMSSYKNKSKEELITALENLTKLNNSLMSSAAKDRIEYDLATQQNLEKGLQFKNISENLPDLIFQFTRRPDGSYFVPVASKGIKNIFGCSPEDVVDDFTPISKVIYPEDAEKVTKNIEYSAKYLTNFVCEFRVQLPGKELQWILFKSIPKKMPDGSITWSGFNANITEQKKAEESLANEKRRLSDIFEGTNIGTWEWNIQTGETTYNERWAEIIGYTLAEISPTSSETWKKFMHPDDLKRSEAILKKHFKGNFEYYEFEGRMKHKNGQWIWVSDKGRVHFWDKDGNPLFMSGTHEDITRRKKNEAELKKNKERYQALLANLNVGIVVHAPDTSIVLNNAKASELLGLSAKQLKGKLAIDLNWEFLNENYSPTPAEEYPVNIIKNSQKEIKDYILGIKQPHKNDIKWVSVNGFPVFDQSDQMTEIVISFIDITERKESEQLVLASKDYLDKIINSVASPIFVKDDKHKFCLVNEALCLFLNLKREDLIGKTGLEHFPENQNEVFFAKDIEVLKTGKENINEEFITDGQGNIRTVITRKTLYTDTDGNKFLVGVINDITESKKAEEKLKEGYALLRIAEEKAKLGGWSVNLEENRSYWSNEVAAIHEMPIGYSPLVEEGIAFYAPEWRDKITEVFTNCAKNGVPYDEEMQIITASGKRVWVRTIGEALKDSRGKIIKVQGAFQDITERKMAEEKIKETSDYLNSLFDYANAPIITWDIDFKITRFNHAFESLTGLMANEVLGKELEILFPKESMEESLKTITQTATGEFLKSVEIPIKHKNGEVRIVLWNSANIYAKDGKTIISIIAQGQDITERKETEDQIRKLSQAVEQSPVSIILTDTKGNIEYANTKTLKTTGYKLHELLNKNPRIFSSGEKQKSDYINLWETILSGKEWRGEFHNKKKNGELYWELSSISPIINETGKITNFLAVKEDITVQKQIIKDLIAAKEHAEESDRLKSAFLANMSHEIRTPMNGILGFAELLKAPGISGEKQQKYIKIIEKSGDRMLNIINDIVDISKIESGLMEVNLTETDINEKIENLFNFFKPEAEVKNIKFSVKNILPNNKSIINTDAEKVHAILSNLIKNAIKFTHKGEIAFGVDYVNSLSGQEQLQFFVKDTGIGIPKDRQIAVFERFVQADIYDKMAIQGAGLGLSISKAYVEMLGGKIWVESEAGIGSTFYFTIPDKKESDKVIAQEDTASKTGKKIRKLKILIAEDDDASEMFLSMILESHASEILIAKNGLEAVEICRNHKDIELIMMDVLMPKLNGYEATRQIRTFNKDVIIIAQTAFALSQDRQKAIDAGCNDYIPKPIKIDDLIALIAKYFK